MAAVSVRPAGQGDLEAVGDLWEMLIEHHRELNGAFWEPATDGREKYLEWAAQSIGADDRVLLVAEVEGQVVGCAHATLTGRPSPLAPRRRGNVTDLVVSPSRRREGVGRALAESLRHWFVAQGADEVCLSAALGNAAAVAFWRAMGYEPLTYGMWQALR